MNVYECRMPDILHELQKGVFGHLKKCLFAFIKDHVGEKVGHDLLDNRVMRTPKYPGLKNWTKGPTKLKQLAGRDEKFLMKVRESIGSV